MSTVNDIIVYGRQLAQTDSNGLTDAQGILYATDALQDFIRALINRGVDAAQIQEAYTSMVSGVGSYAWPPDLFELKTIEVNFQDQTQSNYIQASKMDISNLQFSTSFDFVRKNQPSTQPQFNNHGDTFEIFPTPLNNNANGIKIFYFLIPTDYSSTGTTLSYPVTLDYKCLSCRVAAMYKLQLERPDAAAAFESMYQDRVKKIVDILAPQSQQPTDTQGIQLTGFEF